MLWGSGCEIKNNERSSLLASEGQSLSQVGDFEAPMCRILYELGAGRRGIVVELQAAGDGSLWVATEAARLSEAFEGERELASLDRSSLTAVSAPYQEEQLCVPTLDAVLELSERRFASLPAAEQGTLLLNVHRPPESIHDAALETLVAALSAFDFNENLWLASDELDWIEELASALSLPRTLAIRSAWRAPRGASDAMEQAAGAGVDLVLLHARHYHRLDDALSLAAQADGGVALGVYGFDDMATVREMLSMEGPRLVLGALVPALFDGWSVDAPESFDCLSFLDENGLRDVVFAEQGVCRVLPQE